MVDFRSEGRAEYRVDWTSTGYEKLLQEFRDFLAAKRDVDAATRGAGAPSGLVGAGGHPVRSAAAADADRVQREYARSVSESSRAHRDYARSLGTHQRLTERAERDRARAAQQEADQSFRQRLQAQQRLPRVLQPFAKMAPEGTVGLVETPTNEKGWAQLGQRMSIALEEGLKRGETPSRGDQDLMGRVSRIVGMQQARERTGFLGRAINAVGWMPGVPQEVYLAQMALGEMGLGLGPIGVAAGLGVGAATGGLLAGVNSLASQQQMQQALAQQTSGGTGLPAAMEAQLEPTLTRIGESFRLSREDVTKLIPAMSPFFTPGQAHGGNFGTATDVETVLSQGLTAAQRGGLSNQQGVQLMSLVTSRTGGDAEAAARQMVQLNDAIQATGANVHDTYQSILQEGAALKAGTDISQFATVTAAVQGTGLQASDMLGGTLSTGVARLAQAAVFGMSEQQYTALQKKPAAFAQRLQAYARGIQAQTGSQSATEELLTNLGFIPQGTNADEFMSALTNGNYTPPAPTAQTNAQLDQQAQQQAEAAAGQAEKAAPWQQVMTLAFQNVSTGLGNIVSAIGNLPGGIASAIGGAGGAGEQVLRIILQDSTGRQIGQGTTTIPTGSSTQTPTPTPGQGPTKNVALYPPNTPNRTNANGRVPAATPTPNP